MIDRQKVINGLLCCIDHKCSECYQDGPGFGIECVNNLKDDVKFVLGPVDPILKRIGMTEKFNCYRCPECDTDLFYGQNYCYQCGRPVNWNVNTGTDR